MVYLRVSLLASLLVLYASMAQSAEHVSNSGRPFHLTVTPAKINRHTVSKMTLRCAHSSNVPTKMVRVFRIRILKESVDGWNLLAEQRDNENKPTVGGNFTASAKTGDISKTFLQISWNVVQDESFGVFKCDVIGFDPKNNTVMEQTHEMDILETGIPYEYFVKISKEAQETVLYLEKFVNSETTLLKEKMHEVERAVLSSEKNQSSVLDNAIALEVLNISFQNKVAMLETKQSSLQESTLTIQNKQSFFQESIKNKQSNFENKFETKFNSMQESLEALGRKQSACENSLSKLQTVQNSLIQWPGGYYALLQPKTGCPVDLAFFGGTHRFQKMHTEDEDSTNQHSPAFPSQTKSQSNEKNFITIELCEVNKVFNTASWPSGSFCIHKLKHEPCPRGFSTGWIFFDLENNSHSSEGRNSVSSGGRNLQLYFCCKRSGSTRTPIDLPTSSPFFLYRYGGSCQAVRNMRYTEEFIRIDTEDDDNNDKVHGSHPDVTNSGSYYIFRLCYYTKQ